MWIIIEDCNIFFLHSIRLELKSVCVCVWLSFTLPTLSSSSSYKINIDFNDVMWTCYSINFFFCRKKNFSNWKLWMKKKTLQCEKKMKKKFPTLNWIVVNWNVIIIVIVLSLPPPSTQRRLSPLKLSLKKRIRKKIECDHFIFRTIWFLCVNSLNSSNKLWILSFFRFYELRKNTKNFFLTKSEKKSILMITLAFTIRSIDNERKIEIICDLVDSNVV